MNTCSTNSLTENCAQESYQVPAYGIRQGESGFQVVLEVPGAVKESTDVSVRGRLLSVEAKKINKLPNTWNPLRRERVTEDYQLRLRLGEDIDEEQISAELINGVLTLSLPKAFSSVPKSVDIQ